MKLSENRVRWIIALMTVALGGVIFLQVRLFRNNVTLREESFRRNVLAAMNDAVTKLEEIDLRNRFFTVQAAGSNAQRSGNDSTTRSIQTSYQSSLSTKLEGRHLSYKLGSPQRVSVRIYDVMGRLDTVLVESTEQSGTHEVHIPTDRMSQGPRILQVRTDSAASTLKWEGSVASGYSFDNWKDSVDKIVLRVAETFKTGNRPSLSSRLRPAILDSVLASEFERNGIDIPSTYAVVDSRNDSLLFGNVDIVGTGTNASDFSTTLFGDDFSEQQGGLIVRFPSYSSFILKELLPELSLNVVFLALVVGCFWYTVRALMRQREFAGRLTDFINNMTHEFKTPLSTIALASEALDKPDIVRSKTKVRKFNSIIGEEYGRMKSQVDKILAMAALEEGDIEFRKENVDLHSMILRAAEHARLEVTARRGKLITSLKAPSSIVSVDAVHMESVLRNILDNAMKYSPNAPSIRIGTTTEVGFLIVRVSDRGIGIGKDHHTRVFEKYYRVPTGNVHDVKGFGLGLSYVKFIVEASGGTIRLESEPGRGTVVHLNLPLVMK